MVDVLNAHTAEVEQSMLLDDASAGRPGIATSTDWFVEIQKVRPLVVFFFWRQGVRSSFLFAFMSKIGSCTSSALLPGYTKRLCMSIFHMSQMTL